jgi:hypothetical protein
MRTLCFTGMDRAEEAKLKLLFSDANEWLGGEWMLMPEAQAEVLVVDLESMYGHMTWLKVHNSGKYVIALTARSQSESEAEHILARPVTVESLVAALSQVSGVSAPISPTVTAERAAFGMPAPEAQAPAHMDMQGSPAPDAWERPPSPATAPPTREEARPQAAPPPPPKPAPPPPPPPKPAAPARPRDPVLWDYLRPGGLSGPSRLELDGAPPLVIDPRTDTYVGGAALKPYIPYCQLGAVRADRWQSLSGADLNTHLAAPNEAQPLARLRWLFALVQGGGELAPGYDANDKYRLIRWPKTEREFPRHFRIATAMMQAPATPTDIAAQSDTAIGEVNDFLNASLDSGFAEPYVEPPAAPESGQKTGGLFGRFRNPRNG